MKPLAYKSADIYHKMPMNNEQLQELIRWLSQQIDHTNKAIGEANKAHNFGREAQYEGMRDAFLRCLNKISLNRP